MNKIYLLIREFALIDFLPDHLLPLCLSQCDQQLTSCTPSALTSLMFILGETTTPKCTDDFASSLWKKNRKSYKNQFPDQSRVISLVKRISDLLSRPEALTIRSDICAGGRHDHRWRNLFQSEYSDQNINQSDQNEDVQNVERIDDNINQWISVPKWDANGSSLGPYPPEEDHPEISTLCLRHSGYSYLDSTDVSLLLRAIGRMRKIISDMFLEGIEKWVAINADSIQCLQLPAFVSYLAELSPKQKSTRLLLDSLLKKVC